MDLEEIQLLIVSRRTYSRAICISVVSGGKDKHIYMRCTDEKFSIWPRRQWPQAMKHTFFPRCPTHTVSQIYLVLQKIYNIFWVGSIVFQHPSYICVSYGIRDASYIEPFEVSLHFFRGKPSDDLQRFWGSEEYSNFSSLRAIRIDYNDM